MTALFDVLIPYARAHPNWESQKAEALFETFVAEGFSYDSISNKPDYMVYASAELLAIILPLMIDEMLHRDNTDNFLVYPMLTAIDPRVTVIDLESSDETMKKDDAVYQERANKLLDIIDGDFIEHICRFLLALVDDPPVPRARLNNLLKFWHAKVGVVWVDTRNKQ
jgi:hypothetical protein